MPPFRLFVALYTINMPNAHKTSTIVNMTLSTLPIMRLKSRPIFLLLVIFYVYYVEFMYAGVDNYSADRRFAEAELSYYMYVMFLTICHPPPFT